MPFAPDTILNWVQHDIRARTCTRCACVVDYEDGVVWTKPTMILTREPPSNWTPCEAPCLL